MNRIDKKFLELKRQKKAAFIVYLTAGYPSIATTEQLVVSLSKSGVDILELGVPFSDPLADGPMIQETSAHALRHHVNLEAVFGLISRLRAKIGTPLAMMGYYNPILRYGLDAFARKAKQSGLDAVIIPDLPIEEAGELEKKLRQHAIHVINFIAPTTDNARIKRIVARSKGFIYYVSLTGVTGARTALPTDIAKHVRYLKRISKTPVCVGFGVSTRQQCESLGSFSDGVIVGSAVMKNIKEHLGKKDLIPGVVRFVRSLLPRHV